MTDYEAQVQRVAEALVADGYDVEVLCMRHPDRPRTAVVNGVTVIGLPAVRRKTSRVRRAFDYGWFFVLAAATLTARHLRRRYAVIQIYTMPDFLVFAAAIPKLLGSRVVAYMNEPTPELFETLYGPGRLQRVLERIEQRVLRFADHAITVTEPLKHRYVERGADSARISVVLNAADPGAAVDGWSPAEPAPTGEFVIACHGTIEDRYGQSTIIEAAHLLRDDLPGLRVVLTGRGSGVDDMLARIRQWRLEDVVSYEGWVSRERLNDILRRADAGIVAQKASPYSHLVHTYKMVDYWIFGLPVIASRLRATSELYGEDVIEYYEAGDAHDLARAIRRLHDDPDRRRELAANGRLAQERHGWEVQKQTYLRVVDSLAAGGRAAVAAA